MNPIPIPSPQLLPEGWIRKKKEGRAADFFFFDEKDNFYFFLYQKILCQYALKVLQNRIFFPYTLVQRFVKLSEITLIHKNYIWPLILGAKSALLPNFAGEKTRSSWFFGAKNKGSMILSAKIRQKVNFFFNFF